MAPIFYRETLPYFQQFREQGIPYVLFNTNIPDVDALSFIGQDLYQSGKLGAELMHLAQSGASGILAVLHVNEDLDNSVHLAEKEKGFRQYLAEKNFTSYTVETLNVSNPSGPDFEEQVTRLLNNSELKGIFVSTSTGTSVIAGFLEKSKKQGIKLIGYDMLEENIRFMKKGIINFLINQNPKRQAFMGINHLVGHLILHKTAPVRELLPLEIITRENLESYLTSHMH